MIKTYAPIRVFLSRQLKLFRLVSSQGLLCSSIECDFICGIFFQTTYVPLPREVVKANY